jgi:hypothetical protein
MSEIKVKLTDRKHADAATDFLGKNPFAEYVVKDGDTVTLTYTLGAGSDIDVTKFLLILKRLKILYHIIKDGVEFDTDIDEAFLKTLEETVHEYATAADCLRQTYDIYERIYNRKVR